MNSTYKISVVIPIYNGEKYLRECLESLLAQTFREYELVLVDDGSKDSSGTICDDYAAKFDFIHVYHKPNEGINQTRKYGVKVALSEWIVFCDQDDTMYPDALDLLWAKHEDTDVVVGYPHNPTCHEEMNLEECRQNVISARNYPSAPWAKLFRKEYLTDDLFDFPREIDGAEDLIMNIRYVFRMKRAPKFVFRKIYSFRRNINSMSHTQMCTIEREMLFYEVLEGSIPSDIRPNYMKAIIKMKLNGLTGPAFSQPRIMCNKHHPYMETICNEVQQYSYKKNFQEWMLLNIPYAWMYKTFSYLVMLKNFLRYHLGLND